MYICEERENDETRGTAMAWGYNNYGQLGTKVIISYSSPVLVSGSHNFVHIAKVRILVISFMCFKRRRLGMGLGIQ